MIEKGENVQVGKVAQSLGGFMIFSEWHGFWERICEANVGFWLVFTTENVDVGAVAVEGYEGKCWFYLYKSKDWKKLA